MIVAILGPTAVGKTKLSVALAKKLNAVIINCDAMQVYKDLNIGTAKATKEEQEGVKHYLLDFVPVTDNYTVYDYQKDARKLLEQFKDQNIVFVGGTGLYLKAALYNYEFSEEEESKDFSKYTNEELYQMCLDKNPECDIHPNNRKRLERYLNRQNESHLGGEVLYPFIPIGLTTDRETLYTKINDRVDQMVKDGLVEEVKSFYDQGIRSKALMTGIGYKELYQYFDGEISLEEAIDLIKKKSRHYAKRQYTWLNHQMSMNWFQTNYDDFNKTIQEVIDFIEEK